MKLNSWMLWWTESVCLFLLMLATSPQIVCAADYLVNTNNMTITRDGAAWDFSGQLSTTSIANGTAHFYIGGDLNLNTSASLV